MANSTTNLDTITTAQAQKEATANAIFDAASPATLFGRRSSTTTALTWGYYGGRILIDGVLTTINNGTVSLSASVTNYVEATRAGVVSKNTTGFTAGAIPLYTIVTGSATVTSYTDERTWARIGTTGMLTKALTDANTTLTAAEARNEILTFSGTLTATRDIVLPLGAKLWHVYNGTNQSLQFIGATGTGITVATTKRAIIAADGTNIVRYGADV
jgi:hypothetical protein